MKNKSFWKSMCHAGAGFIHALKTERNLRIDLVIADLVLIFAHAYGLQGTGYAVLILTICAVMAAELFNTAIEETNNAVTEEYNEKIKTAKDISAAAVIVSAIGAVIVGISLFLTDADKFITAILNIVFLPKTLIMIVIVLIIGIIFILNYEKEGEK